MDRRETNHKWYASFDSKTMTITFPYGDDDEMEVPAKYEVCDTCEGKGKHVNPSIDSNGLSSEDFAEDPDFMEDYLSGAYDVQCHECHGERVVPVPDLQRMSVDEVAEVDRVMEEHWANQREMEAERRMGA